MLCEVKSGFVSNFIVYTGKDRNVPVNIQSIDPALASHLSKIVISDGKML